MNDDVSMSESLGSELTLDDEYCSDIPEEDESQFSDSSGELKHYTVDPWPSQNKNKIFPVGNMINHLNVNHLQTTVVKKQYKNCIFLISPLNVKGDQPVSIKQHQSKWREINIASMLNELKNKKDNIFESSPNRVEQDIGLRKNSSNLIQRTGHDVSESGATYLKEETPNQSTGSAVNNLEPFDEEETTLRIVNQDTNQEFQKYLNDEDIKNEIMNSLNHDEELVEIVCSPSGFNNPKLETRTVHLDYRSEILKTTHDTETRAVPLDHQTTHDTEKIAKTENDVYSAALQEDLKITNFSNKTLKLKGSESFDLHLNLSELTNSESEFTDRSTNRFMGQKRRLTQESPRKAKNVVINYPSPHKHTSKVTYFKYTF